jgi:hypothetical protein
MLFSVTHFQLSAMHIMSDNNTKLPPGNTEAKILLLIYFIVPSWMIILFVLDRSPGAIIPTVYLLPFILALALYLAIRLSSKGTASIPLTLGLIGILYIAGGGIFDMIATVIHTPTLQDESNMVGRALLDSNHRLVFVYAYAIVTQALFLALVCTLWLSLLRHRDILIATLGNPESAMELIKAATGGSHLTWRQWIVPYKTSEMAHAYPIFWFMVIILLSVMTERWYFGLEWFNLVPRTKSIVVPLATILVGLFIYFMWLWHATHRPPAPNNKADEPEPGLAG